MKIPNLPVDGRFQIFIEKNSDGITEETTEIYDGKADIGVVTYFLASVKTKMYSYFNLNELITIAGIF